MKLSKIWIVLSMLIVFVRNNSFQKMKSDYNSLSVGRHSNQVDGWKSQNNEYFFVNSIYFFKGISLYKPQNTKICYLLDLSLEQRHRLNFQFYVQFPSSFSNKNFKIKIFVDEIDRSPADSSAGYFTLNSGQRSSTITFHPKKKPSQVCFSFETDVSTTSGDAILMPSRMSMSLQKKTEKSVKWYLIITSDDGRNAVITTDIRGVYYSFIDQNLMQRFGLSENGRKIPFTITSYPNKNPITLAILTSTQKLSYFKQYTLQIPQFQYWSADGWVNYKPIQVRQKKIKYVTGKISQVDNSKILIETDLLYESTWSGVFSKRLIGIRINGVLISKSLFSFKIQQSQMIFFQVKITNNYLPDKPIALEIQQYALTNSGGQYYVFINTIEGETPVLKKFIDVEGSIAQFDNTFVKISTDLTFLNAWQSKFSINFVSVVIGTANVSQSLLSYQIGASRKTQILITIDASFVNDKLVTMTIKPDVLQATDGKYCIFDVKITGRSPIVVFDRDVYCSIRQKDNDYVEVQTDLPFQNNWIGVFDMSLITITIKAKQVSSRLTSYSTNPTTKIISFLIKISSSYTDQQQVEVAIRNGVLQYKDGRMYRFTVYVSDLSPAVPFMKDVECEMKLKNNTFVQIFTDLKYQRKWDGDFDVKLFNLSFDLNAPVPNNLLFYELDSLGYVVFLLKLDQHYVERSNFELQIKPNTLKYSAGRFYLFNFTELYQSPSLQYEQNISCQVMPKNNNYFQVQTDMEFLPNWKQTFKTDIVSIWTNHTPVENNLISFEINPQNLITLFVKIDKNYQENVSVALEILPYALKRQNGTKIVTTIDVTGNTPIFSIFMGNSEFENLLRSVSEYFSVGETAWRLFGVNYYVSNFIIFYQLTILSVLPPIKELLENHRNIIYHLFEKMNAPSYQVYLFHKLSGIPEDSYVFPMLVEQQLPRAISGYLSIGYFGYSSDFLKNMYETIFSLVTFALKLFLFKVLSYVPIPVLQSFSQTVLDNKAKIILFEIAMMVEQTALILGIYGTNHVIFGFVDYSYRVNILLTIFCNFFFLQCIFLLFISQASEEEEKTKIKVNLKEFLKFQKEQRKFDRSMLQIVKVKDKKNRKFSKKKITYIMSLLDNFMFFIIPFTSTMFNPLTFLISQTLITICRLLFLVKNKRCFSKYQFTKEFLNKTLWAVYNICYLFLLLKIGKDGLVWYYGIGAICLIIGGISIEVLFMIIDFIIGVFQSIKKLCKSSKIQPQLQMSQESKAKSESQTLPANTNTNKNTNKNTNTNKKKIHSKTQNTDQKPKQEFLQSKPSKLKVTRKQNNTLRIIQKSEQQSQNSQQFNIDHSINEDIRKNNFSKRDHSRNQTSYKNENKQRDTIKTFKYF